MAKPRQYTAEEMRDMFLDHCWTLVNYWAQLDNPSPTHGENETRARLSGLMHSFLTSMDGMSGNLSFGFTLVPSCHPSDPEYHRDNGDNWYPPNENLEADGALSFMMHDYMHKRPGATPPSALQQVAEGLRENPVKHTDNLNRKDSK